MFQTSHYSGVPSVGLKQTVYAERYGLTNNLSSPRASLQTTLVLSCEQIPKSLPSELCLSREHQKVICTAEHELPPVHSKYHSIIKNSPQSRAS